METETGNGGPHLNPSAQAETGGSVRVGGQSGLHREFQDSQEYIIKILEWRGRRKKEGWGGWSSSGSLC